MDMSKSGMRVQASGKFPKGTILTLSLRSSGLTEEAISFEVEVRWCQEDPGEPDRYILGLHVVEGTEQPWLELLPKILDQLNAFTALISSAVTDERSSTTSS